MGSSTALAEVKFLWFDNAAEVGHVCYRVSYHWENYMAVLLPQYLCGGKLKSGAGTLAGSRRSQIRFSVWKRQQQKKQALACASLAISVCA